MQSFAEFNLGTITEATDKELDIIGAIKSHNGSAPVVTEDDHITSLVPTKEQLNRIIKDLPTSTDYEVLVHSSKEFKNGVLNVVDDGGDEQDDIEYEIEPKNIDNLSVVFELIVYTYNTSTEESLDEIKRVVKVNSKGKRRIKMQCKKGFKFDGTKCVKISGKELVNKRKSIRKAVRTKKSKGGGYQKRVARLRNRANKKRSGMGLR